MQDNPLVSVLINNYNYGRFLKQAIDSALNQTYPHLEVIVVDDGSTDNSREIIGSYGDKITPVLKENGGQASAFNAGFAASQGKIICFLDSDDAFLPEKLTEVVKAFDNHQELGWCFHFLKQVDVGGQISVSNDSNKHSLNSSNNQESFSREYDLRDCIKTGQVKGKIPALPSTSGLCFNRSLLEQILPMPEAKTIGLNDSYLEFAAFGLSQGLILNKELALYRVHDSNAYSRMNNQQQVQARIIIHTAYWLRHKFPRFSKCTNKMLAIGIGMYKRAGGIESECKDLVKKYLSSVNFLEKIEIYAEAFFNFIRNTKY